MGRYSELFKQEFREHPLSTVAGVALVAAVGSVATHEIEKHYHNLKDGTHELKDRAQRRLRKLGHDSLVRSGVDPRPVETTPDISEFPAPDVPDMAKDPAADPPVEDGDA